MKVVLQLVRDMDMVDDIVVDMHALPRKGESIVVRGSGSVSPLRGMWLVDQVRHPVSLDQPPLTPLPVVILKPDVGEG